MRAKQRIASLGYIVSFAVLAAIVFATILAPYIAPYDPLKQNLTSMLKPPSSQHFFGTDELGRDVFSRILYGGRISLSLTLACALVSAIISVGLGVLSAVGSSWLDTAVGRLADVQLAVPTMIIAIVLLTFAGNSLLILSVVMVLSGWVTSYRIIRVQARIIIVQSYIDAAKLAGAKTWDIVVRHILPGVLPITIVAVTINTASILIALSGLNYLGLGLQPPTPDWGGMVASGQARLSNAPWISIFPGIILVLTILATQNLGDALSDRLGKFQAGSEVGR